MVPFLILGDNEHVRVKGLDDLWVCLRECTCQACAKCGVCVRVCDPSYSAQPAMTVVIRDN